MDKASAADVIVVGLGPAGRALAHRCVQAGLDVLTVDPHPDRRWTPTYAAWADELPSWLGAATIASRTARPSVWTTHHQHIDRTYCVLDTSALQNCLDVTGARTVATSAVTVGRNVVTLADGSTLHAGVVIDARGTTNRPELAQQTAYGVVVPTAAASHVLGAADAWFMDWRRDNGTGPADPPSFLYAVPLSTDEVLLEETCLVGRPALGLRDLHIRLDARLRNRGILLTGGEPVERVRFGVESARQPVFARFATTFGSKGGQLHPGTGYSVAAALGLADDLATAIAAGRRPREVLWPWTARTVQGLRQAGLRTLLALQPDQVGPFFAAFFDLSPHLQRAYLSGRTDVVGNISAMSNQFAHLPADLRRVAVKSTLRARNDSPYRADSTIMGI